MHKQTLGKIASELFACNPYRILGVAVNSSADEITKTYKKLLSDAENGTTANYTSPFDGDFLPPFTRDEQTIRSAYVKLASNGYRCFAFSDPLFCTALNVDDIALNINSISCYDCFLRCYMWLVVNDREFEEHALWIPLAKHIDKIMTADKSEWAKYFDNRFPENIEGGIDNALSNLHETFKEIILLPLKQIVRGSMKCTTAADVLKYAGISMDEPVPVFDIPQANAGTPEGNKLKIAVKEGEDFSAVSNEGGADADKESEKKRAVVEHNIFAQASSAISAEALITEGEEYDMPALTPPKPPESSAFETQTTNTEKGVENAVPESRGSVFDTSPEKTYSEDAETSKSSYAGSAVSDSEDAITVSRRKRKTIIAHSEEESADNSSSASFSPLNDNNSLTDVSTGGAKGSFKFDDSIKEQAQQAIEVEDQSEKTPYKSRRKGFDIISSYDNALKEDVYDDDDVEKSYLDILKDAMRSNRNGGQMKAVDTNRTYHNGGKGNSMVASAPQNGLDMDALSVEKGDKRLLSSSSSILQEETDIKKLREQKYRDININDMINPNMGKGTKVGGGSGELDPIEVYKIEQRKQKSVNKSIWKALIVCAVILAVICIMIFSDIF